MNRNPIPVLTMRASAMFVMWRPSTTNPLQTVGDGHIVVLVELVTQHWNIDVELNRGQRPTFTLGSCGRAERWVDNNLFYCQRDRSTSHVYASREASLLSWQLGNSSNESANWHRHSSILWTVCETEAGTELSPLTLLLNSSHWAWLILT